MSDALKSQEIANEKKGWKGLLIAAVLSVLFLGIFYIAMSNEPDYMPSNQSQPHTQASTEHQHDGKTMSDAEMKHMNHAETSSEHAH